MFCQELPKVELHAHLHGSVRMNTLLELVNKRIDLEEDRKKYYQIIQSKERSMNMYDPASLVVVMSKQV